MLNTVLRAANKALSGLEYFSELVAAKGPLTGSVQPQPYQAHQHGAGHEDAGHYAPEANPTSPFAVGDPHGAGWAHGPQTAHTYLPGGQSGPNGPGGGLGR